MVEFGVQRSLSAEMEGRARIERADDGKSAAMLLAEGQPALEKRQGRSWPNDMVSNLAAKEGEGDPPLRR